MPDPVDTPAPVAPTPVAATVEDIQKLLAPFQAQMDVLVRENAELKEKLLAVPATKADVGVDIMDRCARHVTIATRPVIENPGDYKAIVDPAGLVRNTNPNKGDELCFSK